MLAEIEMAYVDPENSTQSPSARALEFAIYFMALCSITDQESQHFGLGSRPELLQQYRSATETLISEANLLRSPNVAVLRAFVIYLVRLGYSSDLTLPIDIY
jgi:hypothetical protein